MDNVNKNVLKPFISLFYKGAKDIPLYSVLGREGNHKLPCSTAIFSMSSAQNCPAKKLGLCAAKKQGANCYARKAEYLYPYALPYRQRQEKFWKKTSAEDFARQFIMVNTFKKNKFTALRMNESGDFWGQSCVDKAEKIARILKRHGNIITYCYTSRSDLDFSNVKSLRISGSNFKKDGITNIFKIIKTKKDRPRGYGMCKMDCPKCLRCQRYGLKTCVIKH
jgi:hypothetical protein